MDILLFSFAYFVKLNSKDTSSKTINVTSYRKNSSGLKEDVSWSSSLSVTSGILNSFSGGNSSGIEMDLSQYPLVLKIFLQNLVIKLPVLFLRVEIQTNLI